MSAGATLWQLAASCMAVYLCDVRLSHTLQEFVTHSAHCMLPTAADGLSTRFSGLSLAGAGGPAILNSNLGAAANAEATAGPQQEGKAGPRQQALDGALAGMDDVLDALREVTRVAAL